MTEKRPFHHALKVLVSECKGCTRCMRICPTEAIRVTRGKAHVNPERCIDCGQCLTACPHDAIVVEQDDFARIFSFDYRAAVLPAAFIGQFPSDIPDRLVYRSLIEIGFTEIYEAEFGVDVLKSIGSRLSVYASHRPIISSFCPAVVRMIQLKFPSLINHINLIRPPLEITAMYIRERLADEGRKRSETGIFYVTPCAAKIALIKTESVTSKSNGPLIDGVINMDYLYDLVRTHIAKNKKRLMTEESVIPLLSPEASLWSLTSCESAGVQGRSLAVDEIHHVIEFLELLENEECEDLDFLELRACAEGCTGGVLTPSNRFLASDRLKKRSTQMRQINETEQAEIQRIAKPLEKDLKLDTIEAKSAMKLDQDTTKALEKLQKVRTILAGLPGIDCGLCGAPSCRALAEDIARGTQALKSCTVLRMRRDQDSRIERIWGTNDHTTHRN